MAANSASETPSPRSKHKSRAVRQATSAEVSRPATKRAAASGSANTQAANFICGGNTPPPLSSTEEFTLGTTTVNAAKTIDFD